MRDGRLEQCDVPQRLYDQPANLFVAGFIGSPAMNIVRTRLTDDGDAPCFDLGGTTLTLTPGLLARRPSLRDHLGREVIVGIRPEDFEDAALSGSANGSCLDVEVTLAEPMGPEVIAHCPLPSAGLGPAGPAPELLAPGAPAGQTLTARLSPLTGARTGGQLRLAVNVDRLHFFDAETEQAIS
jgi:multiple sugar transport system ATP-binding protein